QWNKYSTQRSIAIPLTAGQVIYLEALSIEGGGGDNLAAGWSIDGGAINVITNEFILFPEGSSGSGTGESSIPEGQTVSSIGNVAFGTLAAYDSGTYLISASGADIWGSNDAFGFIHQDISGDIEMVAKVNSLTNTNSWAKAGVMIRETLNPDSKHAMSIITPGNGVSLQRRTVTGGASASTSFGGISAPQWVKILRVGDSFTGYFSSEGSVWFPINSVSISMTADVKAGLALTSHDNSQETESIITDVSVKSPDESSAVTRFVLVNADTGEDIRELSHNSTISISEDGLNLSVRAETSGTNESVVFLVNGSAHFTANESVYAISGTTEGSYNAWTPAIGSMTLMATPYSQDDGSGNVGSSLAIVVTVSE
ncbi:MAG: hypothetical protein NE327_01120, partial [Lentisphaeraceae bacterium]|nr:hypothetical protein [Lentisphaeraceae bacterium]